MTTDFGPTPAPEPGHSATVANRLVPSLVPWPNVGERISAAADHAGCSRESGVSVVVGESVVVRWLPDPVPPAHPSVRMVEHLAAVGFPDMPRYFGREVVDGSVVAILTEYVSGAVDGGLWYSELLSAELDAGRSIETVTTASRLGAMTARLHQALATPSPVLPLPVGWHGGAREAQRGRTLLRHALESTSGATGFGLATRADRIRASLGAVEGATAMDVQPVHGNLHVGQLLRTGAVIMITGFGAEDAVDPSDVDDHESGEDDDPDRSDGRRTPMADLASLVQSVDQLGRRVARRRSEPGEHIADIMTEANDALVAAYRRALPVDAELLLALRTTVELEILERAAGGPEQADAAEALFALYP